MVIIQNDINQSIIFIDDRVGGEMSNPVSMIITHIATQKIREITTDTFDASEWGNGMYSCSVIDTVTNKLITSFTVKLIDIISLTLTENKEVEEIHYPKNR